MNTGYYFSDLGVMVTRSMRHVFRSVDTIITVAIMPIGIMLLFVYVFGGAMDTGSGNYIDYMLPGILLMAIGNGVAYTAVRLNNDVTKGIFDRFHSMPITRSSVLWGHVLTSLAANAISLVVIMLVALLCGFRSPAGIGAWLVIAGILTLFTLATTWLAIISGLTAKTVEGAGVFAYPLIFLPFISSAFVPTASMPAAVRIFAENQPVTAIVDSVRSLMAGQSAGSDILASLLWCIGIMVVAYVFAMRAYKKRAYK